MSNKKRLCAVLCVAIYACSVFYFLSHTQTEHVPHYIEVPKEIIKEVPVEIEKIIEVEVTKEVPIEVEKIIEKEVVVEVEIIKEVPVEVEVIKEVIIKDNLKILTWDEVKELKVGDTLVDVLISGNSFVKSIYNEEYPSTHQTYWTIGAKQAKIISMSSVCKLKLNYGRKIDNLLADYFTYGNVGILTATIEAINWNTDEYGNCMVEIIFSKQNFEFKNWIDYFNFK